MWKYENDNTQPVITAHKHIESCRKGCAVNLPKTAILFYMHSGMEYTVSNYHTEFISEHFPSFLNSRPVYKISNTDVCFLHGGWGAPQAADTLETLAALGVEDIISVGMFGAFGKDIESGDIIVPNKAFVEEGTSLHYYSSIDYSTPDLELLNKAVGAIGGAEAMPVVSADAVYRQTYYKRRIVEKQGSSGCGYGNLSLVQRGKLFGR